VEEFAEYFRDGTDWQFVVENINYVREIYKSKTNVQIGSNTTINIYNINVLKYTEEYLRSHWPWLQQIKTTLTGPKIQSARNLPDQCKTIVMSRHQTDSKWDKYTRNFLGDKPVEKFENFITWHKKLDAVRNQKLADSNPELAEWIETYANNQINPT
jgi:hypothetical protein